MRRPARAGALLAILLWAGCGNGSDPAQEDAAALVKAIAEANAQAVAEAAPAAPEPDGPILKAPTTEEHLRGCPVPDPDWEAVKADVAKRNFAALDAVAEAIRGGYAQTPSCEPRVWVLVDYYETFELPYLDAWISERPGSWAALSARAGKWVDLGYERRGTRFSKDVTEEQWAGMRDAFAHAQSDLMRALEIDPGAITAYGYAIQLLRASGGPSEILRWLDALIARDPLNYGARRRAIEHLTPEWGGSYQMVRKIADDAQQHADRNPRLRILLGFAEAQRAVSHWRKGEYAEAVAGYRRALRHGEHWGWHNAIADCLWRARDWKELLAATDAWLAAHGDSAELRMWRGQAHRGLGKLALAIEEYDRSLERWPTYARGLHLRGEARLAAGRLEEAAADLRRSLEIAYEPQARDLLIRAVEADPSRAGESLEIARRLTAEHPDDADAWFLLGRALHATGAADARGALERYVAMTHTEGDSARVARARRLLDPRPDARTLPALQHFGLSRPEVATGAAPGRS